MSITRILPFLARKQSLTRKIVSPALRTAGHHAHRYFSHHTLSATLASLPAMDTSIKASQRIRPISSVRDVIGLHYRDHHNRPRATPFDGAIAVESGAIDKLYNQFETQTDSTINALMNALFHKLGNSLRVTQHKAYPAYSLCPEILADIIHHLEAGTIENPSIKHQLITQWAEVFHQQSTCNKQKARDKVATLLDLITHAKKESQNNPSSSNMTEVILLSFLYQKSTSRNDLLKYVYRRNELNAAYPLPNDNHAFNDMQNHAEKFKMLVNSVKDTNQLSHHANYESLLVYLMLSRGLRPAALERYGYQDQPSRPNCVEQCIHNLCNMFLYDSLTDRFDFSLLPPSLTPNPSFVALYAQQRGTLDINSPEIGQQFMNLLSGNHHFQYYGNKDYELEATSDNFIPIMNFLFGCKAKSLSQLGKLLSTEHRKIRFKQLDNEILISINNDNQVPIKACITFSPSKHIDFTSNIFHESTQTAKEYYRYLCDTISPAVIVDNRNLLLLVMNSSHLLKPQHLMALLSNANTLEQLEPFLYSTTLVNEADYTHRLITKLAPHCASNQPLKSALYEALKHSLNNLIYHIFESKKEDVEIVRSILSICTDIEQRNEIIAYGLAHAKADAMIDLLQKNANGTMDHLATKSALQNYVMPVIY